MSFFTLLLAAAMAAAQPPDIHGLWHGAFRAQGGEKRVLDLALSLTNGRLSGEVETPTRNAALVDGNILPDGFSAIAQSDWDGKLARRPIEGRLEGATLKVKVQAWPGGPFVDYVLQRVSRDASIPKPKPIPPPKVVDLPYNGLAKTPPMGWSSWNKFGCRVNDRLIRETADAMVASGMKDAGYVHLNIDDCWQGERDGKGVLHPDRERFPDMKALAEYVHSKGLKLGVYSSPGPKTCAGYDGSYGFEEQDAKTYASWGIDYLKYDWCSAGKLYRHDEMRPIFQKMGRALQATGRPIVYGVCQYGLSNAWEWAPKAGGNLWRTTPDIGANWASISEIGFDKQEKLAPYAGPGHWNDPDMLEVGNGDLTVDEQRAHMSLWAMLAAPLIAGNDVRSMSPALREILLNREVIELDQDPLGKQGSRVLTSGKTEVWTKPLSDGSIAVAMFNRGPSETQVNTVWKQIGIDGNPARVRDLWRRHDVSGTARDTLRVASHGVVLLRVWSK